MTTLTLNSVVEQIRNEIKVDSLGKGSATIRGAARLVDVDHSNLVRIFSGVRSSAKLAEFLTVKGFGGDVTCTWGSVGIPDIAVACIVEFYAFEAGSYCTELAKLCYRAFSTIGIREWMQDITGWAKPTAPVSVFLPEQRVEMLLNAAEKYERIFGEMRPATAQLFKDRTDNLLLESNVNNSNERWKGVVSFAESLGHQVAFKGTHYRGNIGAWVQCFANINLQGKKEERICNGTDQPIWVYPTHISSVRAELEKLITEFYQTPNPNQRLKEAGWFRRNR